MFVVNILRKYADQGWGQVQYLYLYLVHIYQYLMYLSTWYMKMSKYLYLTKSTWYLASNFQVLFIKKCKSSYLFEYIIVTVSILGTNY